MFPLLFILFVKLADSCFPTSGVNSPTVTPPTGQTTTVFTTSTSTVSTSATAQACCPALEQSPTQLPSFPDGLLTFTYNNDVCRTTVVANCSQTDPAFNLFAGLFANRLYFLNTAQNLVLVPGTCNQGTWFMTSTESTVPLAVSTLECVLSNPATIR